MKVNNIKIYDNFLDEYYYKKLEKIYCVDSGQEEEYNNDEKKPKKSFDGFKF
jgi:hypothetical protein